MKTRDRIKEEIGLEKLLLTLLVAIVSSFTSWTWSNQKVLSEIIVNSLYFLSIILIIIAFMLFVKIKLKIRELDRYEY